MIEFKKYNELKSKKVVSLAKTGDAYAVTYKKFDPDTGEHVADEVVAVDLAELRNRKNDLMEEIKQIDNFIADCEDL